MPFGINSYPRSTLPENHWEALYEAGAALVDEILDDLAQLAGGTPFAELTIAEHLPPKYLPRYDEGFLRKFLVCLVSVGLKMRLPGFHPAGCTAEEIAYYVMKGRAAALLGVEGVEPDFDALDDESLEDADHEMLWMGALDGIEATRAGEMLAVANLAYEDWFKPFNPPRYAHPYLDEGETPPWVGDRELHDEEDLHN